MTKADLISEVFDKVGLPKQDAEEMVEMILGMIKQTLKRRHPGFNESYYGFKSFNDLLEEAAIRGLLDLKRDEKSGGYIVRGIAHEAGLEA